MAATHESHKENNTGPWFHNALAVGYLDQYYNVMVYSSVVVHALSGTTKVTCYFCLLLTHSTMPGLVLYVLEQPHHLYFILYLRH